jgi:hypothetical protein
MLISFSFNPAVEFASFNGKTAKGEVEEEKNRLIMAKVALEQ